MPDRAVSVGFFGKLPARGDFVGAGLPRGFVDPWDAWWRQGIARTRAAAADWVAAWLEAPVWRFRLPPGCCGVDPVVGLWMPSVDRVGRYFPLTIAAVGAAVDAAGVDAGVDAGFLDAAEAAGLAALADDMAPDALTRRIGRAYDGDAYDGDALDAPADEAVWWTQGGPRVAACTRRTNGLAEGDAYAAMIDESWAA